MWKDKKMVNKTITATYTDSVENLEFYAKAKGYTDTVYNPDFTGAEGEERQIPNPVSLEEFLKQQAEADLLGILTGPITREIKSQTRLAQQQAIEAKTEEIKSGLNVDVQ